MTSYVKKRKEEIIQYMYYTCWVFSLLQYCDMTVYFWMEAYKKASIAGGRIDTENDSALFIYDATDERITVGGAFTIDGRCSTMHEEKSPVRA